MRSVEQIQFLFPERKITINTVQEWCRVIESKKTIRRILTKNLKLMFQGKLSYYVFPDEYPSIVGLDFTHFLLFLYHFYSASPFSGTFATLSLPFLLCLFIFGHVYCSFFTVFALPLHFRACILPFLYRFCSAAPFSGTYTALSLPFLLYLSIFGHETPIAYFFLIHSFHFF